MQKEVGIKIWQREDGTLRIMKWVCNGQSMRGIDRRWLK